MNGRQISEARSVVAVPPASAHPHSVAAYEKALMRAERHVLQGRYAAAAAGIERAIAAGGDPYNCRMRMAELLRSRQEWTLAAAEAERARSLAPNRLPALEMLTTLALEAGDPAAAIETGRELLKISPNNITAHSTLGSAYIQIGNVEAALEAASALVRIDPDNPSIRYQRGLLYQDQGEVAAAVREFVETVRLDEEGPFGQAAEDALQTLDTHQLDQILMLAIEDAVFRAKLERDCLGATFERGFYLSPAGCEILLELRVDELPECMGRTAQYH